MRHVGVTRVTTGGGVNWSRQLKTARANVLVARSGIPGLTKEEALAPIHATDGRNTLAPLGVT